MRKLKFMRLIVSIILSMVLIVGSVIFSKLYFEPVYNDYKAGKKAVSEMKNEIKAQQKVLDNLKMGDKNSVTGVNRDRVKSDVKVVTKYFKPIFEWSSGSDYDEGKAKLSEVAEKSVVNRYFNLPGDVDELKASSKMGTVLLYPVKIAGKTYVYYCVIPYDVSYTDKDGNNVSLSESAILTFSVDGDSKLDTIVGYNGAYNKNVEEIDKVSEEDVKDESGVETDSQKNEKTEQETDKQ